MANKRQTKRAKWPTPNPLAMDEPQAPQVPAWLHRVREKLDSVSLDSAKKIFIERGFDAVVQMMNVLPSKSLEETAAASNDLLVLFSALRSPEMLPELEKYEPLASPYLKGLEARHNLLKEAGGLMSSEEVGKMLRLTRQAIDKRRINRKLIAIPQGQRGFGYPVCQFTPNGPLPGLDQMLSALGREDAWMQLLFLLTPNSRLFDRSPLDLLRTGKPAAVITAARTFGEHGTL